MDKVIVEGLYDLYAGKNRCYGCGCMDERGSCMLLNKRVSPSDICEAALDFDTFADLPAELMVEQAYGRAMEEISLKDIQKLSLKTGTKVNGNEVLNSLLGVNKQKRHERRCTIFNDSDTSYILEVPMEVVSSIKFGRSVSW